MYVATPQNKKFQLGLDLSFAELVLANLAIFLAINYIQDSPFIIFDEVDAHFDKENMGKFLSSVGRISKVI